MEIGTDVTLDDPNRSAGTNPDVLCSIRGLTWGFACKMLHGAAPQSLLNLVEDGVAQIDNSPAQTGIVLVNIKNRIDHSHYWPPITLDSAGRPSSMAFRNHQEPMDGLTYDSQDLVAGIRNHLTDADIGSVFRGHRSVPAFALWAQTTALVEEAGIRSISCPHLINLQAWRPLTLTERWPIERFAELLGDR
jgi:hypothetical protein